MSTLLFTLSYQVAIDFTIETLTSSHPSHLDRFMDLQVPQTRELIASPSDEHYILTHLTFADDLIFPMFASDARELLRTTVELLVRLRSAFRTFALPINWSKGKTELLLRLVGPEAKGIWHHIR
eukprot:6489592-Amphidinium_carterae.2